MHAIFLQLFMQICILGLALAKNWKSSVEDFRFFLSEKGVFNLAFFFPLLDVICLKALERIHRSCTISAIGAINEIKKVCGFDREETSMSRTAPLVNRGLKELKQRNP